jgi:hypothetical protein
MVCPASPSFPRVTGAQQHCLKYVTEAGQADQVQHTLSVADQQQGLLGLPSFSKHQLICK